MSALLLLLEPTSVMLLAAIVLRQRASLIQLAGAALVCAGVLITTQARKGGPARPVETARARRKSSRAGPAGCATVDGSGSPRDTGGKRAAGSAAGGTDGAERPRH